MIRYLKNIISGNNAHWNNTHNLVISDLWNDSVCLDATEKIIFKNTIVSCALITGNCLGPNRMKSFTWEHLSIKRTMSLLYTDYEEIVKELLRLFLTILSFRNKKLNVYCFSTFNKLYNEELIIKNISKSIQGEDVKEIVREGLNKFIKASKILKKDDPALSYSFFVNVTVQLKPLEENILDEIHRANL